MTNTLRECLRQAKQQLGGDSASLDSQLLLANILNKDRTWLLAHDDDTISEDDRSRFEDQINKRSSGYPVAYLIGYQEFWSLKFRVTEATLIPRPDTEILVEQVLSCHPKGPATILDLGTGSGAIAISLAKEYPMDCVFGMDFSAAAVAVAQHNKHANQVSNVHFFVGDWSQGIANASLDIIVSNPPYIEDSNEHLTALKYEPRSALISGSTGLNDIVKITQDAARCLKPNGILALEHGYNQQEEVISVLSEHGFTNINGIIDLGGNPRVVMAQNP